MKQVQVRRSTQATRKPVRDIDTRTPSGKVLPY